MTDEEHAKHIRDAAYILVQAIKDARGDGLYVCVDIQPTTWCIYDHDDLYPRVTITRTQSL